jgi:hypothetical protein
MSPTAQVIVVGVVVAAAAAYVLRAAWRTWFGRTARSCGGGCGKCTPPAAEPKEDGRFPLQQL